MYGTPPVSAVNPDRLAGAVAVAASAALNAIGTWPVIRTPPATLEPVMPSRAPPAPDELLYSATPITSGPSVPVPPGAAPTVYEVVSVNFCSAPEPWNPDVSSADWAISVAVVVSPV